MALFGRALGLKRDLPQFEALYVAGVTAGGSYEHVIGHVPDLTVGAAAGTAGLMPINGITIRAIAIIAEAALTGVATNNFTLNIRQWRGGTALGTIGTVTFAAGTNLAAFTPFRITPTAGNIIKGGDVITAQLVSNGTGLAAPAMTIEVEWVSEGFGQ